MKVEFKFALKQKVLMSVSKVQGKVHALWLDADKIKWIMVRYVDLNKNIRVEWVREKELRPM